MPLTSNCDAVGVFPEAAFNKIIAEVMYQNPSTFNYATRSLIEQKRYCSPINAHPALIQMGKSVCSEVDKIPIIGSTDNSSGFDFCLQVKDLKLDFHPNNTVQLPPELGSLVVQQFALTIKICAGISCGNSRNVVLKPDNLEVLVAKPKASVAFNEKKAEKANLSSLLNIDRGIFFPPLFLSNLNCFCIDVYAVLTVSNANNYLSLNLIGLEMKDIAPVELENSIECYLKSVLQNTVFPKMKIEMSKLVFSLDSYATVSPMPISAAIPFNPSVTNDSLSVYLKIQ